MSITRNQLRLLRTAKSKLRHSDETFRTALVQIIGKISTKDLDTADFETMMGFFAYCGFTPLKAGGEDYSERPGMASFAQIELISALWSEFTAHKAGEAELNKWLDHYWRISSLRFLTAPDAPRIITALKEMKLRAA